MIIAQKTEYTLFLFDRIHRPGKNVYLWQKSWTLSVWFSPSACRFSSWAEEQTSFCPSRTDHGRNIWKSRRSCARLCFGFVWPELKISAILKNITKHIYLYFFIPHQLTEKSYFYRVNNFEQLGCHVKNVQCSRGGKQHQWYAANMKYTMRKIIYEGSLTDQYPLWECCAAFKIWGHSQPPRLWIVSQFDTIGVC